MLSRTSANQLGEVTHIARFLLDELVGRVAPWHAAETVNRDAMAQIQW
jgi:hypothetical protein